MKKTKERRAHERKRVIFGAKASAPGKAAKLDCVVRNFSEGGACVELKDTHKLPDDIALNIARTGRKYEARVIWSQENAAGVAFQSASASIAPDGDLAQNELEERLRVTERKMRKLRHRVKELTGEA